MTLDIFMTNKYIFKFITVYVFFSFWNYSQFVILIIILTFNIKKSA